MPVIHIRLCSICFQDRKTHRDLHGSGAVGGRFLLPPTPAMDVVSTASAASASSAGAMTTQQQGDPTGAGRGVTPQGLRRDEATVFHMHMG